MLNRRILRIRVFQTFFAYCGGSFNLKETLALKSTKLISLDTSIEEKLHTAERFLISWLNDYYYLYLFVFKFLIELKKFEEKKIKIRKSKLLPTEEDLNPSLNFVRNKVLDFIENNPYYKDYMKEKNISPLSMPEHIKILHEKLNKEDFFKNYLKLQNPDFKDDKKFVLNILEFLWAEDEFFEFIEEQTVFWSDNIDFALEMAYKTIKNQVKSDAPNRDYFLPKFKNQTDKYFALNLLRKSIIKKEEYLDYIEEVAQNWDVWRMAMTDRALLIMAITEALNFEDIPLSVTIDEYVEIAKFYGTPNSSKFVNGILQSIFCKFKDEKLIKKSGRGLIDKFKYNERCKK